MTNWFEVQNYLVKESLLSKELHEMAPSSAFYRMEAGRRAGLLSAAAAATLPQQTLDELLYAQPDGSRITDMIFHSQRDFRRCRFSVDEAGEWLQITCVVGAIPEVDVTVAARELAVLSSGGVVVEWGIKDNQPQAKVFTSHSVHLPSLEHPEDVFEYWLEAALDAQQVSKAAKRDATT